MHRRVIGIGRIKVFAKSSRHRQFKTALHRNIFDHGAVLLIGVAFKQAFKGFYFRPKARLSAFGIAQGIPGVVFSRFKIVFAVAQFGQAHFGFFGCHFALLTQLFALFKMHACFFKGLIKICFDANIIKFGNGFIMALGQAIAPSIEFTKTLLNRF